MTLPNVKLKFVARLQYGDALPPDELREEGTVEVYGSNGPYTTCPQANTLAPVIVVGRKGSYGKLNWSDNAVYASDTTFFIDANSTTHNLRWLYYALQSLNLDTGSEEAAVPGLNRETAYAKELPLPPLRRQQYLAALLDRETARLDQLVAAKQTQLELIAEKRRALITRAVTQGLDAEAPRRETGLPWLGAVPEHWEVKRLRYLAEVRTGIAKGRTVQGKNAIVVPYLRVANVQAGYLNLTEVEEIEIFAHELLGYALHPGDVLMNEGGDADKLGRGTVWGGQITPCIHQNHVFAVRCFGVNPMWLATVSNSDSARFYFESRSKQSTNLASISSTNIKEFPVLMPPTAEQDAILLYIEIETEKLDTLREETEFSLTLMHERRAAVIAAAVTGHLESIPA